MPTDKDKADAKGLLTLIYAGVALMNGQLTDEAQRPATSSAYASLCFSIGEHMAAEAEKLGLLDIFTAKVHS